MWSFPKHKPQFHAASPRLLAATARYYSFGRPISRPVQQLVAKSVAVPGARRFLAAHQDFELPCGWDVWRALSSSIEDVLSVAVEWGFYRSPWRAKRFSAFAFGRRGPAIAFAQVQPSTDLTFHPIGNAAAFRVPTLMGTTQWLEWTLRRFEPMPPHHLPVAWDSHRIVAVSEQVPALLAGQLARPADLPAHWMAIHGDMTPWNLRVDRRGRLWLTDWEAATWGPPAADVVRFAVSARSIREEDPHRIAEWAIRSLLLRESDLVEAVRFWLQHRTFQFQEHTHWERPELTDGKVADADRAHRERRALELLAGDSPNQPQG